MQRALNRVLKDSAPDCQLLFCTRTLLVVVFVARRGVGLVVYVSRDANSL